MPLSGLSPKVQPQILTTMYEYKCYTNQGSWKFYADTDTDALRLALFYCWRDGEDFIRVESSFGGQSYTLRLCKIDKTNSIQTI